MKQKPSYLNFSSKAYKWKPDIDYKNHPELYRVGKGEQGVLICEPYKSEIGQFWRFKTMAVAEESSAKIYELFLAYLKSDDFVGAEMARKYLQMGLQEPAVTLIIREEENTIKATITHFWKKELGKQKKRKPLPFSIPVGSRQKAINSMSK